MSARIVAIFAALLMCGCAAFRETTSSSLSVPNCRVGADCEAKWSAARSFVLSHAAYKIANESADHFETDKPGGGDSGLAAQVRKVIQPDGSYAIEAKFWCENIFRCTPDAEQTLNEFDRTVSAAGITAAPAMAPVPAHSPVAAASAPAPAQSGVTPTAISGVKIVVKDLQKAIDFYTKLGLKVGQKYGATELEMLSDNPQAPRLILVHDESARLTRAAGGSSLMIRVPDVKATAQMLTQAGYAGIGEPTTTARSVELTVKDPDGDEIEMLSPLLK